MTPTHTAIKLSPTFAPIDVMPSIISNVNAFGSSPT